MKDINFIVGQNIRDLRHRNGLTTKMLGKVRFNLAFQIVTR